MGMFTFTMWLSLNGVGSNVKVSDLICHGNVGTCTSRNIKCLTSMLFLFSMQKVANAMG